jgi:hypothetical protein
MIDDGTAAEERVKVVYCGGCNPHIDRTAVAAELPVADADVRPGTTVHISGCPRACASDHQLASEDPDTTIVAGELVDGVPTPSPEIVPTVTRKLKE